jgi:hypothetical protein
MIDAFMDESGIHEGAHVCVIAGYWGSVKKWNKFEPRWKQILKDAHELTLTEFHGSRFWGSDGQRKGVFASWSDEMANKFINDLLACIVDTKVFPTAAVLVRDEFAKLNRDERMFLTGGRLEKNTLQWVTQGAPNKVYFLPFQFAIINPAINCMAGLRVHYVFDLNKQFKKHALDLYATMKNDPDLKCRHRLGALDFEVSEAAVGLQAADLLAHQIYQYSKIRIRQGATTLKDLPPILRTLLTHVRDTYDLPFFDAEGLNVALHNMPKHMRSPDWKPVTLKPQWARRII